MFREIPRRGWALVADTLALAAGAVATGAVASFLAMVAFGVLAEEGFAAYFAASDADPILRLGVGVTALVVVAALGLCLTLVSVSHLATAEQLAAHAEREPDVIPGWTTRRVLELGEPFSAFTGFAIVFLILDVVAVFILLAALGETFRSNPESAWEGTAILGGLVLLGLITGILLVVRRAAWMPQWRSAVSLTTDVWRRRLPRAVAEERNRRRTLSRAPAPPGTVERALGTLGRRGVRVGGPAFGIAIAVTVATLIFRQPCRRCDPLDYEDAGEAALDLLARTATVALALSLALLVLAVVAGWASRALAVARLARHAADPSRPRPDRASLEPAFANGWPLQEAGLAAVAIGGGAFPLALSASIVTGEGGVVSAVLAVLAAVGVAVIALAEGHVARRRGAMRAAWSLGDIRPTVPPPPGTTPPPEPRD